MAGEAVGGVRVGFCCVAARSRWRGSARMAWRRGTVGIGLCGVVCTGGGRVGGCVARRPPLCCSCGLVRVGVVVNGWFVFLLLSRLSGRPRGAWLFRTAVAIA
jgi:hypothetical protein